MTKWRDKGTRLLLGTLSGTQVVGEVSGRGIEVEPLRLRPRVYLLVTPFKDFKNSIVSKVSPAKYTSYVVSDCLYKVSFRQNG